MGRVRPGLRQRQADDFLPRTVLHPHAFGIDIHHAEIAIEQDEGLAHVFQNTARPIALHAQRGLQHDLLLLGADALARLDNDGDNARRPLAVVQHRRVIQIHPDLLGLASAIQREFLVLVGQRAAGKPHAHHVGIEVGDFGPAFENLHAEPRRVAAAGEHRIGLVVDHHPVGAPKQNDGHGGSAGADRPSPAGFVARPLSGRQRSWTNRRPRSARAPLQVRRGSLQAEKASARYSTQSAFFPRAIQPGLPRFDVLSVSHLCRAPQGNATVFDHQHPEHGAPARLAKRRAGTN